MTETLEDRIGALEEFLQTQTAGSDCGRMTYDAIYIIKELRGENEKLKEDLKIAKEQLDKADNYYSTMQAEF